MASICESVGLLLIVRVWPVEQVNEQLLDVSNECLEVAIGQVSKRKERRSELHAPHGLGATLDSRYLFKLYLIAVTR